MVFTRFNENPLRQLDLVNEKSNRAEMLRGQNLLKSTPLRQKVWYHKRYSLGFRVLAVIVNFHRRIRR